jgi:flagellar assembly factor FliW
VDSAERQAVQEKLVASLLKGHHQDFFFPEGLLGFSSCQRFTLSRYQTAEENESPFFILQAVNANLSFPLISPQLLVTDYQLTLPPETLVKLATDTMNDLVAMAIVTLRPHLEEITANLQGPVLFNPIARLGLQIIAEHYPVRHPILQPQPTAKKKTRRQDKQRRSLGV